MLFHGMRVKTANRQYKLIPPRSAWLAKSRRFRLVIQDQIPDNRPQEGLPGGTISLGKALASPVGSSRRRFKEQLTGHCHGGDRRSPLALLKNE